MPMSRPTPAASPRAVTRVRLQRRHSSCRTYRIETMDRAHLLNGAPLRVSHPLHHMLDCCSCEKTKKIPQVPCVIRRVATLTPR